MAKKNMDWVRSASVGPQFAFSIGIGWVIGWRLDLFFGTAPVLQIIFSILGVAAGFVSLFRELALINREEARGQAEEDHERKD